MDVSIKGCPGCGGVVLSDTTTCPSCGHHLGDAGEAAVALATEPRRFRSLDVNCPTCGSRVPRGQVRCPDCRAFMDPELARRAGQQPQSAPPAQVSYQTQTVSAELADDEDFELESDVQVVAEARLADDYSDAHELSGDEDDFALHSDVVPVDDGSGEYELQTQSEADTQPYDQTDPGQEYALDQPADDAAAYEIPAEGDPPAIPDEATPPAPEADHSVATAGDALFAAALAEERESTRRQGRRKSRRTSTALPQGAFLVFCPNGHRIVVQEKHRGRIGRCPNCKTPFFVPAPLQRETVGAASDEATSQSTATPAASPRYPLWIEDVWLHMVNPGRLKIKESSLTVGYDAVDLIFSEHGLLVATMFAGNSAFRAIQEPRKKPLTRAEVREHLLAGLAPLEAPAVRMAEVPPPALDGLKLVQPAVPGEESLFHNVEVFGPGRIAVRFPALDSPQERAYLSFPLSKFRAFVLGLSERFGNAALSQPPGVPLTDSFTELTCHYSDNKLAALQNSRFYSADPAFDLQIIGWKCAGCSLVVSEDSRKKEKIGGKAPASVAKATCPKCKSRFGDNRLYSLAPPKSP